MIHPLLWPEDIVMEVITVYMHLKTWVWVQSPGEGREDSQDKALGHFNIENWAYLTLTLR